MKRKTTKAIAIALVFTMLAAPQARAVLGVGDVVFDPSNYAQAIRSFFQLQQQFGQLVQLYQQARQQYDQMRWMAKTVPVNMRNRYLPVVTPWTRTSATNTYGTTAGWISSMNSGLDVESGYASAIEKLSSYDGALSTLPTAQADRVKRAYGTVELTDGANLNGLSTIGRIRSNAPALENTLRALEDDSLSSDPEMNTEVGVLNKINAASVIGLRSSQDTNKLLANLAEEQIIAAKRTRDAETQAINQHIRFMNEGKAALDYQSRGASEAMLAWRLP